jgi:hypothetical protein
MSSNKKSKLNWKDQAKSLIKVIEGLLKVISEEHDIPLVDLENLFKDYLQKSRHKKTSD